jgi:hypothetical protein
MAAAFYRNLQLRGAGDCECGGAAAGGGGSGIRLLKTAVPSTRALLLPPSVSICRVTAGCENCAATKTQTAVQSARLYLAI